MIHFLAKEHPKHWDEALNQAEFAYNFMINRSRGSSPFNIVYTKALNQIVDLAMLLKPLHNVVEIFFQDFSLMLEEVKTKITYST